MDLVLPEQPVAALAVMQPRHLVMAAVVVDPELMALAALVELAHSLAAAAVAVVLRDQHLHLEQVEQAALAV